MKKPIDKAHFEALLRSVREAGRIHRGEARHVRVITPAELGPEERSSPPAKPKKPTEKPTRRR